MSHTAMVKPGLDAVFALDGTEQDYVHHELFHKFMEHKQHGEGQLLEKAQRAIDYDSDRWIWYLDGCEKDYRNDFTLDIVYEEITGDLCEYAMSGSETMRNRLEGLFEPGTLDALCKEARRVFAANRTGKRIGEGNSQIQPSSDRNPRYYLEESAETNAGDVNKVHNLQAEKSAPSSVDGNSGGVNNIHTGEMLASLREAGAYEGLSAYLLRQAIPQAEGSSLAALVRDRQAQAPGLSRTQAVQDLAAEYVDSRLFTDADAIRQLAEARPETARQILDWLRSAESPDESLIQAEKLYTQALGEGDTPSLMPEQTPQSEVIEGKNRLPHVDKATINPNKLTHYALNPDHPIGRNKAKVFESVLGYNQNNAVNLMNQIYEKLPQCIAVVGKADIYGQRYTVDIPIIGENSKTAIVRTGWIIKSGTMKPELTTLFVK